MNRIFIGCAVAFSLSVASVGTAEAGWVITDRYTVRDGKTGTQTTYFQKDQVRQEGEDAAQVMDFKSRTIIWIRPKERKYSVMTFDEFRQTMREAMEASRKMKEEMKKLGVAVPGVEASPEGKVSVEKIAGATIAGYGCDGYRVSVGKTPTDEIWVTRKIDLLSEVGPAMMKEFEEITREARRMGPGVGEGTEDPEYRKITEGGYPMKTVNLASGFTREVTRVEKKSLDASLFEEPKGYKKESARTDAGGMGEIPSGSGGVPVEPPSAVAPDPAGQGAKQGAPEKKGGPADGIPGGAVEGIKKLFKW
jgi:hypothetical protein